MVDFYVRSLDYKCQCSVAGGLCRMKRTQRTPSHVQQAHIAIISMLAATLQAAQDKRLTLIGVVMFLCAW